MVCSTLHRIQSWLTLYELEAQAKQGVVAPLLRLGAQRGQREVLARQLLQRVIFNVSAV